MKYHELVQLGLIPKALNELEIDHVPLIVNDEFHRPDNGRDYRARAIDRLANLGKDPGLPFHSETNTLYQMVSEFVHLECPYDGRRMDPDGGAGNLESYTVAFKCKRCNAQASISLQVNALHFGARPKKGE